MHQTFNIKANDRLEFYEVGDFFRLMSSTGPVDIEFYNQGKEIAEAVDVSEGYGERFFGKTFDRFAIKSKTTQSVQVAARLGGEVWYDKTPVGDVNVVNSEPLNVMNYGGDFMQKKVNVSNVKTVINPARPRQYLLIENRHPTGNVWIQLGYFGSLYMTSDMGDLNQVTGIKIGPGQKFELQGFAPKGDIQAIGDISDNQSVLLVVG